MRVCLIVHDDAKPEVGASAQTAWHESGRSLTWEKGLWRLCKRCEPCYLFCEFKVPMGCDCSAWCAKHILGRLFSTAKGLVLRGATAATTLATLTMLQTLLCFTPGSGGLWAFFQQSVGAGKSSCANPSTTSPPKLRATDPPPLRASTPAPGWSTTPLHGTAGRGWWLGGSASIY
jgi:hypothetical protein